MALIFGRSGAASQQLRHVALTALLLGLISMAGITNHELWTPDEPREAAIALAMHSSGNRIVPQLAGEPFVEKPPLAYIVSSSCLAWFKQWLGPTAALRMSSAIWGLATLLATFMLARRLAGIRAAALATAALAVMPGFVQVTHWLLVDNALMFFITASIWLLCESYLARRPALLPAAGITTAGAFLAKGFLGPIFIGLGWLGIMLHLLRSGSDKCAAAPTNNSRVVTGARWMIWHVLAGLAVLLIAGVWVIGLYRYGGPDLWREWFWDNHFGRFTGEARHLGHSRGPLYYIPALAAGGLPWLAVWLNAAWNSICGRRPPVPHKPAAWPVVLMWGLGGVILLSLSSTKREIYLSAVWPCLGIITGMLLQTPPAAWVRRCLQAWQWLALVVILAAAVAPAVAFAGGYLSISTALVSSIIAIPVIAAAALIRRRVDWSRPLRWVAITALAYLLALTTLPPVIDYFKNLKPVFTKLAAAIPTAELERVGLWESDETTRAGFYYYCNLDFPQVRDTLELSLVLSGRHPRLESIVAAGRNFPPKDVVLPEWTLRAQAKPNVWMGWGRSVAPGSKTKDCKRELMFVTGSVRGAAAD
ncbi:MAG: ArnT family glycosyltransferase [Kiritimatiellia bacterium]